jgi:carboxyl-terminal processing protease
LNKTLKNILIVLVVIFIGTASFAGGFVTGHFVPLLSGGVPSLTGGLPTPSSGQQTATPQDMQTLFKPFWEAWTLVHDQYVDQPVDDTKLMQGAISGMMASLGDKHTSYLDPKSMVDLNTQLSGQYAGIGAYVDTTGKFLTVTNPIPGSPAEAVGIQAGDVIIKIDGVDMTGVDPETVRQKVLGPAGSVVTITVTRAGSAAPIDFKITREIIVIKSATGKMLPNGIAYVQITTFGNKTTAELKATLKELMAQNPKGLILDLRFNGGGYLQTAVEVVSQFLKEGVVLNEKTGDGKNTVYDVQPGGLATDIPMVVLINEGSASASEITAGALQDYKRAVLVGVTSYGKGSVQLPTALSNDQGMVRVTIAKWFTPKDRTIDGKGLTPDVVVPMADQDYINKLDPQLDAAIATLMAMLNGQPLPTSVPTSVPTPVSPHSVPSPVMTPTP